MKKILCLALCTSLLFSLVGCSSGTTKDSDSTEPVTETKVAKTFDIDLTTLSSTMVYSEVYNMTSTPEEYVGKTVQANGNFSLYHNETTDKYYYACLIEDAAACCSQGIEFVLKDTSMKPEDYPEIGTPIVISGVFDFYEEDSVRYIQLVDAEMSL